MKYRTKNLIVDAVQLVADISYKISSNDRYETSYDKAIASKGDWLVIENGKQHFMKDADFKARFESYNG